MAGVAKVTCAHARHAAPWHSGTGTAWLRRVRACRRKLAQHVAGLKGNGQAGVLSTRASRPRSQPALIGSLV